MHFNLLETPPTDQEAIRVPTQASVIVATAPPLQLFQKELRFWRERLQQAQQNQDPVWTQRAERLIDTLGIAAMGRAAVELSKSGARNLLTDQQAGLWYVLSLSTVAFSRLLQEIEAVTDQQTVTLARPVKRPKVCDDFVADSPHTVGLQVMKGLLENGFGIQRPGRRKTTWYEGRDIYLEVKYPSEPSRQLQREYTARYGLLRFPYDDYTSVRPRLKRNRWEIDAEQV